MPQEKFCFFDKDAGKHGLCKPRKKSDKKQEHDKQCILNNDTNRCNPVKKIKKINLQLIKNQMNLRLNHRLIK